ncbi:MAG: galactose mutarotase [Prolixibacteraceae bacterium]|jgi:aldose 1-epimerase|nr:galactose mutarotase [Prolixibacteraceae bacterium]
MNNKASDSFTLKNDNNVEITFTAHGGRLISIKAPSPTGEIIDVVVGYDTVEESLKGDGYFAAICGRFANRIADGKFELDGVKYQLDINNSPNHLHGGRDGFNNRVFDVEAITKVGAVAAYKLTLISPDGDQNYPGELTLSVIYSLTADNQFCIEYEAETTKATIINLTSHPYINLAGSGNVLNHEVQLMANKFTPIDAIVGTCVGDIAAVSGTAFDFTSSKKLNEALTSDFDQVKLVDGIDHNFVINNGGNGVVLAAIVKDPESGRKLEVYTDQPGVQVYTGNHFDGSEIGKGGRPIVKYGGIALETQIFPNSPNCEAYPNAILRPGEKYKHTCIYKFC